MKRIMCCPKCKNTDLVIPTDLKDKVICHNCEHSFHSLEYYKEKKLFLNKVFLISSMLFVIPLLIGTVLFFLPVYSRYDMAMGSFLYILSQWSLSEKVIVGIGMGLYAIAIASMIILFICAYYSHTYHLRRMYLRKHGFLYEKREKGGNIQN